MFVIEFESIELLNLFQTVLVPVLMISGVGLFIMIIQTRYGRVVDRIRAINMERLTLIREAIVEEVSNEERIWNSYRLRDLQKQMEILVNRGGLLKNSLIFMFISIFTFIMSSLLLFVEQVLELKTTMIIFVLFTIGLITIFIAGVSMILEVKNSYNAVIYDLDTHVPKEYRIRIEEKTLGDLD